MTHDPELCKYLYCSDHDTGRSMIGSDQPDVCACGQGCVMPHSHQSVAAPAMTPSDELDVESLAESIHKLTCLAPSWNEAAARHRKWDVQSMQERVDLYRRAGYGFARLTPSKSPVPEQVGDTP